METVSLPPSDGGRVKMDKTQRNIWCPKYDECLMLAARHDISLDCTECAMSKAEIPVFVLTLSEIEGCKALMDAIFHTRVKY